MYAGYRLCDRLVDALIPEKPIQSQRVVGMAADGLRRRPYAPVQTGDPLWRVEIAAVETHGNRRCQRSKSGGLDRLNCRHQENGDWHSRDDVSEVACKTKHCELLCWFDPPCGRSERMPAAEARR